MTSITPTDFNPSGEIMMKLVVTRTAGTSTGFQIRTSNNDYPITTSDISCTDNICTSGWKPYTSASNIVLHLFGWGNGTNFNNAYVMIKSK